MKKILLVWLFSVLVFLMGCTQQLVQTVNIVSIIPAHPVFPENITITWNVQAEGNKTTPATAVYYDTRSHPGVFDPTTAPEETGYALQTGIQEGTVPKTFHAAIQTQPADHIFFRAHARIDGKNYWTSEYRIAVGKL